MAKQAPLFLLLTNNGRTRRLLDKGTRSSLTTKRLNEGHIELFETVRMIDRLERVLDMMHTAIIICNK